MKEKKEREEKFFLNRFTDLNKIYLEKGRKRNGQAKEKLTKMGLRNEVKTRKRESNDR